MARELENKVLQLFHSVLGGSVEPTPKWLKRPGKDECGEDWTLICVIYTELTGRRLPETMPPRERRDIDCVLKIKNSSPRIIEVDEIQHFNRYRAQTIRMYPQIPLAFDSELWIKQSEAKSKLEGGGFGKPKPPLFPDQWGRHQQRAFRDVLADILPLRYGFLPTLRIAYFEVEGWLYSSDAPERMKELLDGKLAVREQ
jgi:hypothetical protein